MTSALPHRLSAASAVAALVGLAACATGPKPAPAAPAAAVAAPPPMVTMAPIANPETAQPTRREPATPRARGGENSPARRAAERPTPGAGPAVRAPATADPAAAARGCAHGGLEELNRGAVSKAVGLLGEASRLDPGNPVIRRDLERAERIDRAVHAPH